MADLQGYVFPARAAPGVLFGLSLARLAALGAAGVVLVVVMTAPTRASLAAGSLLIALFAGSAALRVAGRPVVEWAGVAAGFAWATATRNREFYATPDLALDLPDAALDLPGELFGLELHSLTTPSRATIANPTPAGYGVLADRWRHRLVAVAEVAGGDFLFLDPDDRQARVSAWGATLDHLAHATPDLVRIQVVHLAGPATPDGPAAHHRDHGGCGTPATAGSYRHVVAAAGAVAQTHRLLVAIALDERAARRAVRHAGGGIEGGARVLMDRAATVEDALRGAGLEVAGWLPARAVAQVLRGAFDPYTAPAEAGDVNAGGGTDPAACGPWGMTEGWAAVRHDSGWSATLQVARPPTRPVAGDFLQHLLVGVAATRRLSMLYVPTPAAAAERRAQTQQVTAGSEEALRARWGFASSARQRRSHDDAAHREADLAAGRAVYRTVWLLTVTAPTPDALEAAVGQVEAAARRCDLDLRRMAGTQRQAFAFTLPVCRGAR